MRIPQPIPPNSPDAVEITVEEQTQAPVNLPPMIEWVRISPERPTVWDDLRLEYEARDPEDAELAIDIQWFADGVPVGVGHVLNYRDKLGASEVRVELQVTDPLQEVARDRASVLILNEVPLVNSCTLASDDDSHGATASWTAASSASDPDGMPPELGYAWQVRRDGVYEDLPGFRDAQFPGCYNAGAALCHAGDEIRVVCEAHDSLSYGVMESAPVIIENTPPTLHALTVTPNELRPGTSATASLAWEELDQQDVVTETLVWRVDGVEVATATATPATGITAEVPGSLLQIGARVELEGSVSDIAGNVQTRTRSWSIGNLPPVIDRCVSAPHMAAHDIPWSAAVEATDPDGDLVHTEVQWQVNNAGVWEDVPGGLVAPSCVERRVDPIHASASTNCRPGGQFRVRCIATDEHDAESSTYSEPGMFGVVRPQPPCELYARAEAVGVDAVMAHSGIHDPLLSTYGLPSALGLQVTCDGWSPPIQPPDFVLFGLASEPALTRPQAGHHYRIVMDGMPNGRSARLYMSTDGVEDGASCPPMLSGDCIDLLNASFVGAGRARGGEVHFDVVIPSHLVAGEHVWFQAVAMAQSSPTSRVMQREIELPCEWDVAEPNDQRTYPYLLGPGTLTGLSACPSTSDWYAVDVLPGDRVTFTTSWDPFEGRPHFRALAGDQGSVSVSSTDDTWTWTSVAVQPGTMYLEVKTPSPDQGIREGSVYDVDVQVTTQALSCATTVDPNAVVSLAATATYTTELCAPDDVARYQVLGAVPGHYVTVRASWDPREDAFELHSFANGIQPRVFTNWEAGESIVTLLVHDGAPIPLEVRRVQRGGHVSEGGGYQLALIDHELVRPGCFDDGMEPNDQPFEATPITPSTALLDAPIAGSLCFDSVYDWYTFDVTEPSELSLTLLAEDDPLEVLVVSPSGEFELLGVVDDLWRGRVESAGSWMIGVWMPGHSPHPINDGTSEYFDYGWRVGSNYLLDVALNPVDACAVDTSEPDDFAEDARVVSLPATVQGTVCDNDVDYVRVHADAGTDIIVALDHPRADGALTTQIEGADGERFSMERVVHDQGSQVRFVAWETGDYLIRVSGETGARLPSEAGSYTLEITEE